MLSLKRTVTACARRSCPGCGTVILSRRTRYPLSTSARRNAIEGPSLTSSASSSKSGDKLLTKSSPPTHANASTIAISAAPASDRTTSDNPAHRVLVERQRAKGKQPASGEDNTGNSDGGLLENVRPPGAANPSLRTSLQNEGQASTDTITPSTSVSRQTEQQNTQAIGAAVPDTAHGSRDLPQRDNSPSNNSSMRNETAGSTAGSSQSHTTENSTIVPPTPVLSQDNAAETTVTVAPTSGAIPLIPTPMSIPPIRHPFNTNRFVASLERTNEFTRNQAEELMRATKAMLITAEDQSVRNLVAKTELENEAYLFSAALSELRTEIQMTARTDAIALRGLNSRLQREVDSLTQILREDINTLKHNNQIDLNNRKEEASTDISNIEQRILELNNKFLLNLGDTKAVLEANKWIQTRRSIVMIASLAICIMAFVSTAPAPAPPAPPRPPSADELGLKQIEDPEPADGGFFSSWLGSSTAPANASSTKKEPRAV